MTHAQAWERLQEDLCTWQKARKEREYARSTALEPSGVGAGVLEAYEVAQRREDAAASLLAETVARLDERLRSATADRTKTVGMVAPLRGEDA